MHCPQLSASAGWSGWSTQGVNAGVMHSSSSESSQQSHFFIRLQSSPQFASADTPASPHSFPSSSKLTLLFHVASCIRVSEEETSSSGRFTCSIRKGFALSGCSGSLYNSYESVQVLASSHFMVVDCNVADDTFHLTESGGGCASCPFLGRIRNR